MLYETGESNSKLNYKIDEIILDYKMLFCRYPQPEEVAIEASTTPEKAEVILERLSLKEDWRRPTKIEKQKTQKSETTIRTSFMVETWMQKFILSKSMIRRRI